MAGIVETVAAEFGDLSAVQAAQLVTRLMVAGLLGGLLGWERHRAGSRPGRGPTSSSPSGRGVHTVPLHSGFSPDGVSRILQGLVAGIGFLGAGCIIKADAEGHVHGLTTAAGLWFTAAVGTAAGLGRLGSAIVLGLLGWFTLTILGKWEQRADRRNERRH